jgi:hypothetical protein
VAGACAPVALLLYDMGLGLHPALPPAAAARNVFGQTGYFSLNPPASVDKIQQACAVPLSQLNLSPTSRR